MATITRTMYRGDSLRLNMAITRDLLPVDLTGATIRMTAKHAWTDDDSAAVFQVSTPSSGIVITNVALGLAEVNVPAAETLAFTVMTTLVYDIQLTESVGIVTTLEAGLLTVYPDITRTQP